MQKPLTSARNNMHIYRQEPAGVGSDCLAAPWSLEIPRKINFYPFKVTAESLCNPSLLCWQPSSPPCGKEQSTGTDFRWWKCPELPSNQYTSACFHQQIACSCIPASGAKSLPSWAGQEAQGLWCSVCHRQVLGIAFANPKRSVSFLEEQYLTRR